MQSISRWLSHGPRLAFLVAVVVAVYHGVSEVRVLMGHPLTFLKRLELTALDVKFAARGEKPPEKWKVAIAAVDEPAIQSYGPLPWSRTIHSQLVDSLTKAGVGAIAFDMTFEQAQEGGGLHGAETLPGWSKEQQLSLQKLSEQLSSDASFAKHLPALKDSLSTLEELHKLNTSSATLSPDAAFAVSLARSQKVVLGVVNLSQTEAQALKVDQATIDRSLQTISGAHISELTEIGEQLDHIHPGGEQFREGTYRQYFGVNVPTPQLARATAHFGSLNAAPDIDGVNRSLPLVAGFKQKEILLPTLALKAVEVASSPEQLEIIGVPEDPAAHGIRLGQHFLETGLETRATIDWYGPFLGGSMPVYSIADIISGKVPPSELKDKVVFVAATAIGTHDQRVTPLERAVPGVYIHATMAQNLLDGRHLGRPLYIVLLEILQILLIGIVAAIVLPRLGIVLQLFTGAALIFSWLLLDRFYFFENGLVVHTVLPTFQVFFTMLAMAAVGYFTEAKERRKTRQAFGRYLSPQVMNQVLSHPEEYLQLGGRRYEATVLFSDIRGFTTISEQLSPEDLGSLLNQYMTPMTKLVFEEQGTLDKYIGDAIMAFWGAPLPQEDHPLRACRAALKMLEALKEINETLARQDLPQLSIGIGLSTGPMTIGNMGADEFFSYTALGDRVNLGARLEGQTKAYGVSVIISEATYLAVKDQLLCRELGALRVKGKNEPARIFELIGDRRGNEHRLVFVSTFEAALLAFRNRDWDEAIALFQEADELIQGDASARRYLGLCRAYQAEPPPPGWDGVLVASSK